MFSEHREDVATAKILCNVPLSRDYTIGGLSSKRQRSGSTNRLKADQSAVVPSQIKGEESKAAVVHTPGYGRIRGD